MRASQNSPLIIQRRSAEFSQQTKQNTLMRVLHREIDSKDSSGRVKVQAEEAEDMYHLYNIVSVGDSIKASTVRNVTREGTYSYLKI